METDAYSCPNLLVTPPGILPPCLLGHSSGQTGFRVGTGETPVGEGLQEVGVSVMRNGPGGRAVELVSPLSGGQ